MSGTQTLVGAGGLALVAVNFWTSDDRQTVSSGIFTKSGDAHAAHLSLAKVFGELVFVVVAVVLAGLSNTWAMAMAAVVVALFVLFAINQYGGGVQSAGAQSAAPPAQGKVRGAAA